MSDPITARISETGQSAYSCAVDTNGHGLLADEPISAGGGNLGPGPYDLLVAALGTCTAMTVRWYARQNNLPLDHVAVDVSHEKQVKADGRLHDVFSKKVTITGDKLSGEQKRKLIEVAGKCPVQRTLTSGDVVITTEEGLTQ